MIIAYFRIAVDSPYFRLDMKCHHVGTCRPFGSPYFRLDLKCHHVGTCRLFGPICCVAMYVTSYAAPDRRARLEFFDLLPS